MESVVVDRLYRSVNTQSQLQLNSEQNLDQSVQPIVTLKNIHKTYLLGVEGVPALRYTMYTTIYHNLYS